MPLATILTWTERSRFGVNLIQLGKPTRHGKREKRTSPEKSAATLSNRKRRGVGKQRAGRETMKSFLYTLNFSYYRHLSHPWLGRRQTVWLLKPHTQNINGACVCEGKFWLNVWALDSDCASLLNPSCNTCRLRSQASCPSSPILSLVRLKRPSTKQPTS